LIAEHGRGGLGRVFRARDLQLGRQIAIKELISRNASAEIRFFREALITARLEHPGIVPVHEAGRWPDGTPFYAMKLVSGSPLSELLERCNDFQDRLALIPHVAAVADAIAYAHDQGIVHRDLKPSNVICGEFGETVVIDWGLAKETGDGAPETVAESVDTRSTTPALTVVGSILGTPAYMAPEQARGEGVDKRADVYAIGAILHHICCGHPPSGTVSTAHASTPRDLWSIVRIALEPDRERRYQSANDLAADLRRFQTGARVGAHPYSITERALRWFSRHRGLTRVSAAFSALLAVAIVWSVVALRQQRVDRDREIRDELRAAEAGLRTAHHLDSELERARAAAFRAFDAGAAPAGEQAWGAVVALRGRVIAAFRDAAEPIERALLLDASRADLRRRYGELLLERAQVAEREQQLGERDELIHRMALYDADGALRRRWLAPAHLAIASDPASAKVVVRRYRAEGGRLVLGGPESLGATPITDAALPPGSLVLELTAPGRAQVTLPVLAGRGEHIAVDVPLPATVPPGFVYVPPGRTLFGSGDAESVRAFFGAMPQHTVETGAYLIARRETTFAEYIAFLEDVPPAERAAHTPSAGAAGAQGGVVALTRGPGGWELAMQPGSPLLRARAGEPIRYPERTAHAEQDWQHMPVMAISFEDALAYAAWADRTGRVPGARLCTETEWERAARGADGRAFPPGDVLAPGDANVDETYGKNPASFGPDVGGLHPASRSPFGVDDLTGNVWEWATTVATPAQPVARGGSFYFNAVTARIANRQTPHRGYRGISVGMRLCTSAR